LDRVANTIKNDADNLSMLPRHVQTMVLLDMMIEHCPELAHVTKFNQTGGKRKKPRILELTDLVAKKMIFPTLVITMGIDGSVGHAVTIVDNLIFDSTQRRAMKLSIKLLNWICGSGGIHGVIEAVRFEGPFKTE
jgi:hypothetical protein